MDLKRVTKVYAAWKKIGPGYKNRLYGVKPDYCDENDLYVEDGYTSDNIPEDNLLHPVFRDGKMLKEYSLAEIRNKLHGGNF